MRIVGKSTKWSTRTRHFIAETETQAVLVDRRRVRAQLQSFMVYMHRGFPSSSVDRGIS